MNLKILFVGNNTLIGEYARGVLHKPRVIAIAPDRSRPQGMLVSLQTLVGNPTSIQIVNPSLIYDSEDTVINNLYIEATTGLTVVGELGKASASRNN